MELRINSSAYQTKVKIKNQNLNQIVYHLDVNQWMLQDAQHQFHYLIIVLLLCVTYLLCITPINNKFILTKMI